MQQAAKKIKLGIRKPGGGILWFKVFPNCIMKVLFMNFGGRIGEKWNSLEYSYGTRKLDPQKRISEQGLKHRDTIEAHARPVPLPPEGEGGEGEGSAAEEDEDEEEEEEEESRSPRRKLWGPRSQPVVAMLVKCELDQFAQRLIEDWGYDTITAIKAVEDEVLSKVGMKHGHIAVFRRAVTKL
jgi:hypothetical protein